MSLSRRSQQFSRQNFLPPFVSLSQSKLQQGSSSQPVVSAKKWQFSSSQLTSSAAKSSSSCQMGNVAPEAISYAGATCKICLNILIEPVILPCGHELCLKCYQLNVTEVNLVCPFCRLRVSIWARKKKNQVVDQKRWKAIQEAFPEAVKQRLNGEETDDIGSIFQEPINRVIAEPGEVHMEYLHFKEQVILIIMSTH